MRSKIICIDFDGVLHSYLSGRKGADVILDAPVDGAVAWITAMVQSTNGEGGDRAFDVCIFSSRSGQVGGIAAMRKFLVDAGVAPADLEMIRFPTEKPPAHLSIDDRAVRFTGKFPTPAEISTFRPWNKRPESDADANVHIRVESGQLLLMLNAHSFAFSCDHARMIAGSMERAAVMGDWRLTHVPRRELIILCGLPFSGMTQVARRLGGVAVDVEAVRLEVAGPRERAIWCDGGLLDARESARVMTRMLWRSGTGRVVVVACNPTRDDRDAWRELADAHDVPHIVQYVGTSAVKCRENATDDHPSFIPSGIDHVNQVAAVFEHPQGWWD